MADLNYKVKVDTKQAQDNLRGLKSRIGGLGTAFKALAVALVSRELVNTIRTFQDLRQTLVTIEGDATKAAKSFELIKQFTSQTTFQLDEVTKAFITFKNAGLQPTEGFMKNIGNIAAGMGKRFDDVSQAVFNATTGEFEMLKQLGIKVKTEGDKLTVNFRGTAKTIENDGRSIIQFLNEVGKVEFAGSIERQSKTLSGALSNLQDNFALALNEVGEGGLTSALTDVSRSMGSVVGESQSLARTIGSALGTAVRFTAENFKLLAIAFAAFVAQAAVARIAALVTIFISIAKAIRTAVLATVALNAMLGKNLVYKLAQGLVFLAGAAATYFGLTNEATAETSKELQEMEKSLKNINEATKATGDGDFLGSLKDGIAMSKDSDKAADAITRNKVSLDKLVNSYRTFNKDTLESLQRNKEMLGMNEEQVVIQQALNAHTDRYATELGRINDARREARALEAGPEQTQKLKDLAKAENELTKEYEKQLPVIARKAKEQYKEIQAIRFANFQVDEQNKKLTKVRQIQDDTRRLTMTSLEKKYDDLAISARESAEAQITEWAKAQNMMRSEVDPTVVKRFYEESFKGINKLRTETKRNYDQQRTWSSGWKRAFNEYVEAADNASAKAERFFTKAVGGMEDIIVNFVKTGKFQWRDFVNSMLEELLRSNIQSLMATIFKGVGLGKLFGGNAPNGSASNPMYVVPVGAGGGGGNAFSQTLGAITGQGGSGGRGSSGGGLGGVLSSIGGAIFGNGRTPDFNPSTTPSGGGIMGGIGNVVKSIGKGIGSIFGGFFADGGTLPAGKIGIVGERGPEFISGPATITPMGVGGSTQINYNINAVDALSFKQLVARDPQFMYAVSEQGRRGTPMGRR